MNFSKNSIVTLQLNDNLSSNTFVVDTIEGDTVLLSHPLSPGILIRVSKDLVNVSSANLKDSTERGIDYANANRQYLDYNSVLDLEALSIFFVVKRKLTPRQKLTLSNICGVIASVKFNNDIRASMDFVSKNSSILDDFNSMWFNNFKGLFSGQQMITSNKQRTAIFNMAGYVLSELENPTARRKK